MLQPPPPRPPAPRGRRRASGANCAGDSRIKRRGKAASSAAAFDRRPPRHTGDSELSATTVASSAPGFSRSRSTVTGLISATEERAKAERPPQTARYVVDWLDPDVPAPGHRPQGCWIPWFSKLESSQSSRTTASFTRRNSQLTLHPGAVPNCRSVQPRAGRAAADQPGRHPGLRPDLPGRCFRLYSSRRSNQGLLHQPAENAGRCGRRSRGCCHLPDGGMIPWGIHSMVE